MSDERKPWDQLPDEPDPAYVRFLMYRDLGPARSIDAAYVAATGEATKGSKRQQRAPGQWTHDSAQFGWPERALAWDKHLLADLVPEAASVIFHTINETARVALRHLQSGKLRPRNWQQLVETVTILASFIAPETIQAAIDHASPGVSRADEAKDPGASD